MCTQLKLSHEAQQEMDFNIWCTKWKSMSFDMFVWNLQLFLITIVLTCLSVRPSKHWGFRGFRQHFPGATLCGPELRNFLPFTLDNDFYRQLRCCRCASNLLFWPWHFSDLSKRSCKKIRFFNFKPWMGATLCGPDLRNFLPFT